jgi:hypothetical protein
MNFPEGYEGIMPMNHNPILPVAVSSRFREMGFALCAAPRPLNAPKIAPGALEPAAASTNVHNRL